MGGGAQRPPSQHTQSKAEQNQSRVLLTVQRLRIKQTQKKHSGNKKCHLYRMKNKKNNIRIFTA